eukprot:6185172-Pleurochrysis_carterae.AAC.3
MLCAHRLGTTHALSSPAPPPQEQQKLAIFTGCASAMHEQAQLQKSSHACELARDASHRALTVCRGAPASACCPACPNACPPPVLRCAGRHNP